ncbi:MAG: hypothetical protein ACKO2K_08370, partial [Alphaproteobacteria bacterium]
MLLEEGEPVSTLLGQRGQGPQVLDGPVADPDRTRPDECRRLEPHQEIERADRLLLEHDRLD